MKERLKLRGPGTGLYEEKRSRFLAEILPVKTAEEAKGHLTAARKKYPDARHHCSVYILPDGECRWSDDGEPGGTAGAPMAAVLKGAGVYGVSCVVTRYFGGILLGSGGLVRAYSKACADALADAGTEPDPEKVCLRFTCRWEFMDRVHRLAEKYGTLLATDYGEDASCAVLTLETELSAEDAFREEFLRITLGRDKFL